MICKILNDNKHTYTTVVLGLIYDPINDFSTRVIVLDEHKENIIVKPMYQITPSIKRKVFIIDADTEGWQKKKVFFKGKILKKHRLVEGYEWILDSLKDMKFEEKAILQAKELDKQKDSLEWHYVNNESDIKSLMEAAWNFHDSYITKIQYLSKVASNDITTSQLLVVFEGCWECSIELIFEDIALIHYPLDPQFSLELFEGTILLHNDYVYFVDDKITDVSEIEDCFICFKSRSLKWKMIIDKE